MPNPSQPDRPCGTHALASARPLVALLASLGSACGSDPEPLAPANRGDAGLTRRDAELEPPRDARAPDGAPAGNDGGTLPPASGDDVAPSVACPANADAMFAAAMASFDDQLRRDGVPGATVAMLCGGERVLTHTYGFVREGGAAVDTETRFQIASTTKLLTGLTAALMADAGMLSLGASIETLVPTVQVRSASGAVPTLLHLLSHSSGFPPDVAGWNFETDALAGLFMLNPRVTLYAEPGAVWNYANYGFTLAGYALELAGGMPFGTLVERTVMTPARMTRATMDASAVLADGNFAYGHSTSFGPPATLGPLEHYYHVGHYAPTGGAWMSASDLIALARFLIVREHLADPGETAVARPRIRTLYPGRDYGLGLFVERGGNYRWWSHSGSVAGFLCDFNVVPDVGFATAVILNGDASDPSAPSYTLSSALTDYTPGAPEMSRPTDADDWVGRYSDPVTLGDIEVVRAGASVDIVWRDGRRSAFEAQWRDGGSTTYPPEPEHPVSVTFWRNAAGAVTHIVTDVGVATKL